MQLQPSFRAGYVSVAGMPNVGKSTLVNRLVGSKLAIVSPHPQTTRSVVKGILTTDAAQIIFFDTAGIHSPKDKLGQYMVYHALRTFTDADLIYLLVDPHLPGDPEINIINDVRRCAKPVFLIINKIDTVHKPTLLPIIDAYSKKMAFHEIIPVSARTGDNVERLLDLTVQHLPESPPLYPPDIMSDQIERNFIAEFIREKIYYNTRDEIPYSSAVVIEDMKERPGGGAYIRASIYLEKESQKGILIGKNGTKIKKIGQEARIDIESFLGYPVYLDLQVKVEKYWRKNIKALKKLGYASSP
ncbi:MAG: GTPase Era [Desulfobacterota bacterium]|nr:GTPase Era [Thermodesulfobacteriota bacterium]